MRAEAVVRAHLLGALALVVGLSAPAGAAAERRAQAEDEGWGDEGSDSEARTGADEEPAERGIFAPDPEEEEGRGSRARLSPRWFWASLAVGIGLGVGAGVTGGYTLSLNQLYLEERSDPLLRQRGMSLQLATNVLIGTASAMGLVALLVGIFTDWSALPGQGRDDEEERMFTSLGPSRG